MFTYSGGEASETSSANDSTITLQLNTYDCEYNHKIFLVTQILKGSFKAKSKTYNVSSNSASNRSFGIPVTDVGYYDISTYNIDSSGTYPTMTLRAIATLNSIRFDGIFTNCSIGCECTTANDLQFQIIGL